MLGIAIAVVAAAYWYDRKHGDAYYTLTWIAGFIVAFALIGGRTFIAGQ